MNINKDKEKKKNENKLVPEESNEQAKKEEDHMAWESRGSNKKDRWLPGHKASATKKK